MVEECVSKCWNFKLGGALEEGTEVDEDQDQEDEEEQQIASFPPEEDSMSRDGTALDGLGGDESRDQEDQGDEALVC